MSTPSTTVPVALTPETGALVLYTGPKAEVKAKKSFINFNNKQILIGVGITLTALAVPAALFYFAPSALLTVGNLALSMFSAQASVNTTLALGASIVATGVAALVGSTIALASFINHKLTVRAAMKKTAAKIAPQLAAIAEDEKNNIVPQRDRFIERLQTTHQEQMVKVQADTKLEPILCVSPLQGFLAEGRASYQKLRAEEQAARAALRTLHVTEAAKAAAKQPKGIVARMYSKSPSREQAAKAVGCAAAAVVTVAATARGFGLL